jgi:hypothetical protein
LDGSVFGWGKNGGSKKRDHLSEECDDRFGLI